MYRPDAFGNKIPDFSTAGYKYGGVPLPNASSLVSPDRIITLSATSSGDDMARIQQAIDQLSLLPMNEHGFRGVVQLGAGEFRISDQIRIQASGIVLRGEGNGAVPSSATFLRGTGTAQRTLVEIGAANGNRKKVAGTEHNIVDKYVPVGATSMRLDSTAGLAVGDSVILNRPSTSEWIRDLGMNKIPPRSDGREITQWEAGKFDQHYERVITRIEGDRVFFNAPVMNAIEQKYGGGTVYKYEFPNRIQNVGVENLGGKSDYLGKTDEKHAWNFIEIDRAQDIWVRDVSASFFGLYGVHTGTLSSRVTIDGFHSLDPISEIEGARRYAFAIDGQYTLMQNLYSRDGRHDLVNNSPARGPNVFLNAQAARANDESGPHQRWSVGTLFDNVSTNGTLAAYNRSNKGSGQGWSGANMVFWNSEAGKFTVANPPTAQNWVVGGKGTKDGNAIFDSHGKRVSLGDPANNPMDSLYLAQLNDRLASPNAQFREYVLGDFDRFSYDGSNSVDRVYVDSEWLSQAQGYAADKGFLVEGFDQKGLDHVVPFSFAYQLDPGDEVIAATLTIALQRTGGQTRNDSLWIETPSASGRMRFADLGFGDAELTSTGSDFLIIEFLGSQLDFLQDGLLNLMLSEDAAVDWATLGLWVETDPFAAANQPLAMSGFAGDFSAFSATTSSTSAVPEPSAFAFLGAGAAALVIASLVRRRNEEVSKRFSEMKERRV